MGIVYGAVAERELGGSVVLRNCSCREGLTSGCLQPSSLIDVIEAFVYDSVIAIEQVCRTIGERLYDTAISGKDPSLDSERKTFMAGRGDLLKIAIIQVRLPFLGILDAIYQKLNGYPKLDGSDRSQTRNFASVLSVPPVLATAAAKGFYSLRRACLARDTRSTVDSHG